MPKVTDSSQHYAPVPTEEPAAAKAPELGWFTRFFRKNRTWVLYLKTLPSLLLLGTFGRRPITIAKLASPAVVESFAAFIGPLLGPILFLALVDSFYIAAMIYQDNWRIKQYEKAKLNREPQTDEVPEQSSSYIEKIREQLSKVPLSDQKEYVKKNMFDRSFKEQLSSQHINHDLFIEHLLKINRFDFGPRNYPEHYNPLIEKKNLNYAEFWLGAQVDYLRLRLETSQKHMPTDPEAKRLFILNNVLSTRTRAQLTKMNIDENKFIEMLICSFTSEQDIITFFQPGKKSIFDYLSRSVKKENFNYAQEWLITEIKALQHQPTATHKMHRLALAAENTEIDVGNFVQASRSTASGESRHEFSNQNIINRFKCLTTEKDFAKEHPYIHQFITGYEYNKKILVFPLRTISLGLAIEVMMPFTLPLLTSIFVYAGIGLCLSFMIVKLEDWTDTYLKELKGERDTELEALHESERVGTFSRLSLRLENFELKQEKNQALSSLKRSKSLADLNTASPSTGNVIRYRPSGQPQSPTISPLSLAIPDPLVSNDSRHRSISDT
jgi:hypothetical protein